MPCKNAYHFFFQEKPWAWVPAFHEAGMPYAHLLAPVVALLIVGVAVSWIIGFLTRLFAFVFLPVVITTLVVLHNAGSPRVEAAWLYLIITVTLLLVWLGHRFRGPTLPSRRRRFEKTPLMARVFRSSTAAVVTPEVERVLAIDPALRKLAGLWWKVPEVCCVRSSGASFTTSPPCSLPAAWSPSVPA